MEGASCRYHGFLSVSAFNSRAASSIRRRSCRLCMSAECCFFVIGGAIIRSFSEAVLAQSFLSVLLELFKLVSCEMRCKVNMAALQDAMVIIAGKMPGAIGQGQDQRLKQLALFTKAMNDIEKIDWHAGALQHILNLSPPNLLPEFGFKPAFISGLFFSAIAIMAAASAAECFGNDAPIGLQMAIGPRKTRKARTRQRNARSNRVSRRGIDDIDASG